MIKPKQNQDFTSNNNSIDKYKYSCNKLFFYNKESNSYQSKFIQIIPNKENPHIIINQKGFRLYNRKVFRELLFEILSLFNFITLNPKEFENELRDLLEALNESSGKINKRLANITMR